MVGDAVNAALEGTLFDGAVCIRGEPSCQGSLVSGQSNPARGAGGVGLR